jgi:ClpP class serine protease
MTWQWLLEASALERLNEVFRLNALPNSASFEARGVAGRGLSTVDRGQVAVIAVEGILTKAPDPLISMFYGANTAYDDIIGQIALAESDPKVQSIRFDIDSPGGNTDGLFETLAAIEKAEKPMAVSARNALSAAYGIAAAAGSITATSVASMFGSVGTTVSMQVNDSVVTLTSTNAPEKRPDPKTEEGRASIIRHLDAIDDLFVGAIAVGRGTAVEAVRSGYGRGASLMAGDAKQRGMIDGIAGTGLRVVEETQATADGGSEAMMDLEELKTQHPAVYKAAAAEGASQERDRVGAHLTLGEKSGDLKTAFGAIRSGADLTMEIQAQYLAASMNRADTVERQAESDEADAATADADTTSDKDTDKFGEAVFSQLNEMVGLHSVGA